jgi:hypothetical protein
MHRMIPALGSIRGFRSAEIEVTHHPRRFGKSKYGFSRFARGFMDMVTVSFLQNFRERPLHLVGGLAAAMATAGVFTIAAAALPRANTMSILFEIVGASLLAGAAPLMGIGLLCELIVSMLAAQRAPLPIVEEIPRTETSITEPLDDVARRRSYSAPAPAPVKRIAG